MPQWITSKYKSGDLAIFDFNPPMDTAEHTGFIESVSGSTLTTIEGNTSDKVMRKTRYTSQLIGAYRPDYTSTQTAEKVLSVARGEIGYTEGSNNDTKYGKAYGLNYQPWCVMFEWWCFREAGMSNLFCGGGKVADCGSLRDYAKNHSTSPSASGSTSGGYTLYCTPKLEIVQSGSYASKGAIQTVQALLNAKGFKGSDGKALDVDGEWGPNTSYAIGQCQIKLGLTPDKSCGAATYTALCAMEV